MGAAPAGGRRRSRRRPGLADARRGRPARACARRGAGREPTGSRSPVQQARGKLVPYPTHLAAHIAGARVCDSAGCGGCARCARRLAGRRAAASAAPGRRRRLRGGARHAPPAAARARAAPAAHAARGRRRRAGVQPAGPAGAGVGAARPRGGRRACAGARPPRRPLAYSLACCDALLLQLRARAALLSERRTAPFFRRSKPSWGLAAAPPPRAFSAQCDPAAAPHRRRSARTRPARWTCWCGRARAS